MSKLWTVINEIADELNEQLDQGTVGFASEENGVCWAQIREYTEAEKEKQESDRLSKLRKFFGRDNDGYVEKALNIAINKYKDDKGVSTLFVSTTLNDKSKTLTMSLTLRDQLRPTMFKIRRLVKRTRIALLEQNSLALDKHLAQIIPNRIDDILLGDKDEGTSKPR